MANLNRPTTTPPDHATQADLQRTIHDLRELIDALDRRIPQVHKSGETDIASAALLLRAQAVARIAEIEHAIPS